MLPGENGIASTWNVPKYNVDLAAFAPTGANSLFEGDDGEGIVCVGNPRPTSDGEFVASVISSGSNSSAITN